MSLNSVASTRVARELAGRGGRTLGVAETDDGGTAPDVQNALSQLVEYIPAETITIYLAVVSALPTIRRALPLLTPTLLYWAVAILTPVLYFLILVGKRRAAVGPGLPALKDWLWPALAATVAFLAWALAVPSRPYLTGEEGGVTAGLLAVVVSVILGVLGRFFAPPAVKIS